MAASSFTHSISDHRDTVVIVLGGAGTVGGAIALDLASKGAVVAIPSRDQARLDNVATSFAAKQIPRPLLFCVDVSTQKGAEEFLENVRKATNGRVDHVVASLGKFECDGPLLAQSLETFEKRVNGNSSPHFIALKVLLPVIEHQEGSTYVIVTGTAGERLLAPGTALVSVGDSALNGLVMSVCAEHNAKTGMKAAIIDFKIDMKVMQHEGQTGLRPHQVAAKDVGRIGAGLVGAKCSGPEPFVLRLNKAYLKWYKEQGTMEPATADVDTSAWSPRAARTSASPASMTPGFATPQSSFEVDSPFASPETSSVYGTPLPARLAPTDQAPSPQSPAVAHRKRGRRFDNAGRLLPNKPFLGEGNDCGAVKEDTPQTELSCDQEEEERSGQGQRGSRLDQ